MCKQKGPEGQNREEEVRKRWRERERKRKNKRDQRVKTGVSCAKVKLDDNLSRLIDM